VNENSANNDLSLPGGLPETSPVLPNSTRSKAKSSTPARRSKGDSELKRLLDLNRSDWAEREDKRLKTQADVQLQIARIQTESQERLLEIRCKCSGMRESIKDGET
jgi:hypothetical protein